MQTKGSEKFGKAAGMRDANATDRDVPLDDAPFDDAQDRQDRRDSLFDGNLAIATIDKNPQTGELQVQNVEVRGPVALRLTTTHIDLDQALERQRCN